jgi:hypothetical protein
LLRSAPRFLAALALVVVLGSAESSPSRSAAASPLVVAGNVRATPPHLKLAPQQSSQTNPIVLSTVSLSAAKIDPVECPAVASSPSSFPNNLHAIFWTAVFSQFVGQHYVANDWLSPSGKHYSEDIAETHPGQAAPITDCGGLLILGYHDQELGHWTFSLVVDSQVIATIPFTLIGAAPTATPTLVPTRLVKRCKRVYRRVHGKRRKVKVCHLVSVKTTPTATRSATPTATESATATTPQESPKH